MSKNSLQEKQNRVEEVAKLLIKANNLRIVEKDYKVVGYQFIYYHKSYGDISLYDFVDNEITELIAPLNVNNNRPGTKKDKTLYVCVHDTASSAATADAKAHAHYVYNGGGGTSWHYSCGDNAIYHQIPDDEVAYHAGDGTVVKEKWTDTGVKASTKKPYIDIIDNIFYFNGEKSLIECPKLEVRKKDDGSLSYYSEGAFQGGKVIDEEGIIDLKYTNKMINTEGLKTIIGNNGNYFLGPVYYNRGFGYIANRLGNLYSIGIETMVNQGSNLLRTWHKCAKLVARLLIDNNLQVDDVKPHHFFSGKPCPQTMRINDEWHHFIDMVNIEYEMLKLLKDDIKISLKCKDTIDGILDHHVDECHYQVVITCSDLTKTLDFSLLNK